jgi:UDP-4-amino-4,6-dideoxy-N-acetyl-beta-L-altrosamine transaminase
MKPIPYGRQEITAADEQAVLEVLRGDFLTQGPAIAAFEEAFAQYVGAPYASAVSNGTAALHLCTLALGVQPGQKVITTPITFAASANCVRYCGGEVVFADIDPETFLLNPASVERILRAHPRGTFAGIIPVDFAGLPADLPAFRKLADEFGLWIIQDSCHSPGGSLESNGHTYRCGSGELADLAIFSFHPVKHIASGEGGMVTTARADLHQAIQMLRTHGITRDPQLLHEQHGAWYYEMQTLGYNYRLTDFQAALGLSQLKRADAGLERRRAIAARYDEAFASLPLERQSIPAGFNHAYHLYVVQTNRRKELFDALRTHNIFAQVHYIPVHLMPYYRTFGWKPGDLPFAEAYYEQCISLPMYPSLTDDQQGYVIETIQRFFQQ